jgi:hypothetical protein
MEIPLLTCFVGQTICSRLMRKRTLEDGGLLQEAP